MEFEEMVEAPLGNCSINNNGQQDGVSTPQGDCSINTQQNGVLRLFWLSDVSAITWTRFH
jgi:hypothetical protein